MKEAKPMEVKLKGSYEVKPAEPTWEGLMALSEFDKIGCITHVPAISFYRRPENWLEPPETITNAIKESLSRVLVPFYPLAGRLRWMGKGRLELECNAAGAQFIEAESGSKIDEFIAELPEHQRLVPNVDYSLPMEEIPVFLVQVTRFACGGISISLSISHAVVDGQSLLHFLFEWAALHRGEPLTLKPFLDRKAALRAGETPATPPSKNHSFNLPSLLKENSSNNEEEDENGNETALAMIRLSRDQVEKLKKMANQGLDDANNAKSSTRAYTRHEAIAAHVWRCACKARRHAAEQPTALGVCVDTRRRVRPVLPWGYFGNAIFDVLATGTAGELASEPLGRTAGRIREAVETVTDEHVWSVIDHLKRHPDLGEFQDLGARLSGKRFAFYENPNLGVVSWLSLPMYGFDFGWGKEAYIGPVDVDGESSFLVPCPTGDGSVVVALCLQAAHMHSFKRHFYHDVMISHI